MLRRTKDGKTFSWNVENDDPLCSLQEAFQEVDPSLGFNIELKFDDSIAYKDDHLIHVLQAILKVYISYSDKTPITVQKLIQKNIRLIFMLI